MSEELAAFVKKETANSLQSTPMKGASSSSVNVYTGSAKKMYTHFNERKLNVV